ncbi:MULTISPECIES: M42 family metallopeptidase [Clostridium]|jgi:Cellulase M and related proteins|uniref:M42 family metallopeptidase n=2 Tax=Clostridium beijerinckii TaxID=1520 RepID=A0A1S8RA95_CLOBE|nr:MULTISPECIES: M42 family metallopeptidase [Clostridium]ABR33984.1 peptidase M42 family protein [Clostridium beijerinckii NCIMB 8052]AIU03004.1 peptidase M42 family protein [Clostridium beijerinckii ATCC 35702]MBE6090075.1 M42 family peptidase [Clostridium beijerinckii]MBF7811411.1 M42 family metallopeptidase [Clostridium beijerinckii]NOW92163.1 putative aminopeptidase FrvX [Clostridium beijerinckii]
MELCVNKEYVLDVAKEILEFDSPTGFCFEIIDKIRDIVKELGYSFETTNKGCGIITIKGKSDEKILGLSAHVDTLGAMVRSITSDGKIKFTLLGGPIVPTLDSEYCTIRTREGKKYTGTFLSTSPAAHVFEDSSSKTRDPKNMEIRIDEEVHSKSDVQKLGICVGDFIFIDPKTTITESGFIKSRFIDDKGSVSCLMGLLELFNREKIVPKYTTKILISTYEEVGHGASYIPSDIVEMIAVDMGCIGDDLTCSEYDVSICAKDSGGPYDYNLVTKLINLAKDNELKYAVDIYPMYGSDVGAALRGGNDIRGALIGPGVHASHGMERTHYSAFENTIKLLYFYLTN